eukprot:scaffold10629_cov20-Tisochrysis_lutea.AAC.1
MAALFKRLFNYLFCPHLICPKHMKQGTSKSTAVRCHTMAALFKRLFYSLCCPHWRCPNKQPKHLQSFS